MSVIRLALDVSDPATRVRVEKLFAAAWSLKRAVQHDARDRVEAYWAGSQRRVGDAKAWRERLGLSRTGLEHAAYAHLEASGHLKDHVTKALAMHLADEVWSGVERHLFGDASGHRAGRPRVGSWWEFTRIPGRARSHIQARKWETFRLAGTLQGHLDAFRSRDLPEGASVADARAVPAGESVLAQPRHLPVPAAPSGPIATGERAASGRPITRPASWWDHTGPLTLVFTGAGAGNLVVPVRLPQGAGRWERIVHFLDRLEAWHKIDLVRRRKPSAPGGWAYEAHLMILDGGHASPATQHRRHRAAGLERRAGIDGNVSNLSVFSAPTRAEPAGHAGDGPMPATLSATMLTLTDAEKARLAREQKKAKGRARALERSRRAANTGRYHLSKRQETRAKRRADRGLPERTVALPKGPRVANKRGVPRQAYRTDTLSGGYHRMRARHAQASQTFAEARQDRARRTAAAIVAAHGANMVLEDCDIRTWARLWGKGISRFTPGMLITALEREAAACGGSMLRASTTKTALSQHCLCGAQVAKSLAQRVHHCPQCGLTAPRDLVAAALASCVTLTDPADPSTARVDYTHARHLIDTYTIQGLQEALSESTAARPSPALAGRDHAAATDVASAQRNAGKCDAPTPDETPAQGTTPDRRTRNPDYPDLRDSS
ncbi:zinc ribbon domain-containing protein [Nonomuraea sp. 3N208]|uniref:zinc ribbon domain-containing protein n=1 Tax=Nonomuraea sp. 3N208 TaxID=3457421 RepID=UPI003FCED6AA